MNPNDFDDEGKELKGDDKTPLIDKIIENNPLKNLSESTGRYETARTQSMIVTAHEEKAAEQAEIDAQQQAIEREREKAVNAEKRHKVIKRFLITIIVIFSLLLVGMLVFIGIRTAQGKDAFGFLQAPKQEAEIKRISGYQCLSDDCGKATDLPDGKVLIRDGSTYYVFDETTNTSSMTELPQGKYSDFQTVEWGSRTIVMMRNDSKKYGAFSITDNRLVYDFNYDDVYVEVEDWMNSFVENYIVAGKEDGSIYLIEIATHTEALKTDKRFYVSDDYYFAYKKDGSIEAYDSQRNLITSIDSNGRFYIRDGKLVSLQKNGSFAIYNKYGVESKEGEIFTQLDEIEAAKRAEEIDKIIQYKRIPAND